MGKGKFTFGNSAVRVGKTHIASLLGWTAFHFLIRLVAFMCVWLAISNHAIWFGVAALWLAFVLLPERCLFGEKLRGFFVPAREECIPYVRWVKIEWIRLGWGMVYALPCAAMLGYWFYARHYLSFKELGQALERLAAFIGVTPQMGGATTTGAVMYFALVLVMALLFAWGWHRDVAVEYLPLNDSRVFQIAKAVRKHPAFCRNSWINFALAIPSLLGAAAVMGPYVAQNVSWSRENLYASLQSVAAFVKMPVPRSVLFGLVSVFLILYVPLWLLRKLRNAAMAVALGGIHAP